jgi:hypothetical protein
MWVIAALATVNPTSSVLETINANQIRAQGSIFRNADGTLCFLGRVNIPVEANIFSDRSEKVWKKAIDLSNTALPSDFTTN